MSNRLNRDCSSIILIVGNSYFATRTMVGSTELGRLKMTIKMRICVVSSSAKDVALRDAPA